MDRVPLEIWTGIFRLSFIDDADFYEMRQSPWPASQVCRQWRQMAISSPSLWTTINISTQNMDQNNVEPHNLAGLRHRLAAFIARSRDHALFVSLDLGVAPEEETGLREILISLLWPHSGRWESFQLFEDCHSSSQLDRWTMESAPHLKLMPRLRNLELALSSELVMRTPDVDPIGAFYSLFANCPSLTSLTLQELPCTSTSAGVMLSLPWEKLRHLTLYTRKLQPFVYIHLQEILARLQELRHFNFATAPLGPMGFRGMDGPFAFPNLRSLHMESKSQSGIHWMLSHFVAPRLEALRFTGSLRISPGRESLVAFVQQSRCRIQYLDLTDLVDEAFAAQVLPHMPNLRLLSVEQGSLGACNQILRYLADHPSATSTANAGDALLCPRLEALNYTLYDGEPHYHTDRDEPDQLGYTDEACLRLLEDIARLLEARWLTPASKDPLTAKQIQATELLPRPYLRFHTARAKIPRVPGASSTTGLEWIRRIARGSDGLMRVNLDVGYDAGNDTVSALWPDSEWTWFEPQFSAESAREEVPGS